MKLQKFPTIISGIYLGILWTFIARDSTCDYIECLGTGIPVMAMVFPSFLVTLFSMTLFSLVIHNSDILINSGDLYIWLAIPLQIFLVYWVSSKVVYLINRIKPKQNAQ